MSGRARAQPEHACLRGHGGASEAAAHRQTPRPAPGGMCGVSQPPQTCPMGLLRAALPLGEEKHRAAAVLEELIEGNRRFIKASAC